MNLISDIKADKKLWQNMKNKISKSYIALSDLNKDERVEIDSLKDSMKKEILERFQVNPALHSVRKSSSGYCFVYRSSKRVNFCSAYVDVCSGLCTLKCKLI